MTDMTMPNNFVTMKQKDNGCWEVSHKFASDKSHNFGYTGIEFDTLEKASEEVEIINLAIIIASHTKIITSEIQKKLINNASKTFYTYFASALESEPPLWLIAVWSENIEMIDLFIKHRRCIDINKRFTFGLGMLTTAWSLSLDNDVIRHKLYAYQKPEYNLLKMDKSLFHMNEDPAQT